MNKDNTIMDIINALAIYKASEAGALEETVEPSIAGIKGALITDTVSILNQFSKGEITAQEGINKIENSVKVAITSTVLSLMNKAVDVTAEFTKEKVPAIAPVVEIGKNIVKAIIHSSVAQKVAEKVTEGVNWVKNKIKSIFS